MARAMLLVGILGALATPLADAQVVATCSDPEGHAYYHHTGVVPKQKSGFSTDRITGGLTTLQRLENGEFDVLIVDSRKQVISYKNDGGRVVLLRKGSSDATFLAVFPGMVIELYTFYVDADGVKRYDFMQSKGGDHMPIHKSTLMSGTCSHLNLNAAKSPSRP